MAKSQQFKFKLPKGCSISELVMRETNGRDEAQAIQSSKSLGEKGSFLNEMLKLSIVSYDDVPAVQPLAELEDWSSKTRSFLLKAYMKINSVSDDKEESDFLDSAELCTGSNNTVAIDELFGKGGSVSRGT